MSDPQNRANADATDNTNPVVTFYGDIAPLFRPMDVQCMRDPDLGPVLLLNYKWMSTPANAQNVLDHLTGDQQPQMPYGGPYWAQENIDLFKQWMQGGFQEGEQAQDEET